MAQTKATLKFDKSRNKASLRILCIMNIIPLVISIARARETDRKKGKRRERLCYSHLQPQKGKSNQHSIERAFAIFHVVAPL